MPFKGLRGVIFFRQKIKGCEIFSKGNLRGMKIFSRKIRGLNFFTKKIRGTKKMGDLEKNAPGGYPAG